MAELRTETMTVNMGPQHPSTHGVLRLVLELDGEIIQSAMPTIGYLHTGIEKTAEQKKWQQVIPLVERMDYLGAQSNSLSYALAVEKLLGLEMPQRVQDIRVLLAELQRLASHLIWLGTHAMEIGAVSMLFYAVRERELLLNINELIAGFRFFPSYIRIGGLREDLPRGFHEAVNAFLDRFPGEDRRVRGAADQERHLPPPHRRRRRRHAGRRLRVGAGRADRPRRRLRLRRPQVLPVPRLRDLRLRGADGDRGRRLRPLPRPRRRDAREPEDRQQAIERITPTGAWACDDTRVVPPPKDKVYTEMEALIQHFLIYSQGFTVPAGEVYVPIEGPRGEHGCYIVSDGTNRPWRVKMRPPSFMAIQALPQIVQGGLIADVVAVIGSNDVVMGDCDR